MANMEGAPPAGPAGRSAALRLGARVACAVITGWAICLVIASYQLHVWQERLAHVLVQLQANALVRDKASVAGQGVHTEWYRHRALTLLQAVEQLHDDSLWTLVMPGSWPVFDDLGPRATQRIATAFGQIVIQTVRREIETRAARLSGAALDPYTDALDSGQRCRVSVTPIPHDQALSEFLDEAARMDQAVSALQILQHGGPHDMASDTRALRRVIRYSLGADLSQPALHSLSLFRGQPHAEDLTGQALVERLEQALRCAASAHMAQWLDHLTLHHEVLAAERAVRHAVRQDTLFSPDGGTGQAMSPFSPQARIRAAITLIEEQRDVLARNPHAWMHPRFQGLDAPYEGALARIASIPLLGPTLALDLTQRARRQQETLRAAVDDMTGGGEAGLKWDDHQEQLVPSDHRIALHAGLMALREIAFEDAGPTMRHTGHPLETLMTLPAQRARLLEVVATRLPSELQSPARRYVMRQYDEWALVLARRYISEPAGAADASDPLGRIFVLESALRESDARLLAVWVTERLLAERRLAEALKCARPLTACATPHPGVPRAPWDSTGESEAPASSAD